MRGLGYALAGRSNVREADVEDFAQDALLKILGALGTCGTFVYETAAQEKGIPLTAIKTTVEGDFDPRGVKGEAVNPRIQAFRVKMELTGPTAEQAAQLAAEFEARCPIHTTLSRAAPIEIENLVQ